MPNSDSPPPPEPDHVGYLASHHDRLRFTDFGEILIARVLLLKAAECPPTDTTCVSFGLNDIFKGAEWRGDGLEATLLGVEFEISDRPAEIVAAFMNTVGGHSAEASKRVMPAFQFYNGHLESRLRYLQSGDFNSAPCIHSFTVDRSGSLHTFEVTFVPRGLATALSKNIRSYLTLIADFHDRLNKLGALPITLPRIEVWKQLTFLTKLLDLRQRETGEIRLSFTSAEFNYRRLLLTTASDEGTLFTMESPGSSGTSEKCLLPLLMESNGLLDILALHVISSPLAPQDVVIQYYVTRPATVNVFEADSEGLTPALRRGLSEDQLVVYSRTRAALDRAYIFGGKPELSAAFARVFHFLLRTLTITIEEPSVLHAQARRWLDQHASEKRISLENDFFLPWLYERMRLQFGSEVVKQPKRFGGELDLLFGDVLPIELKVRRNRSGFLPEVHGESGPRGVGQASTYAALSRVAFLLTLDVPDNDAVPAHLDACVRVFERTVDDEQHFPVCVVSMVFQCRLRSPSLMPD
ncbi:MAG: hypothetical protein H6716_29435 [Polyangiaceae bacterium]|nr:hypothetical protein [Polyangiaceae bacterium]